MFGSWQTVDLLVCKSRTILKLTCEELASYSFDLCTLHLDMAVGSRNTPDIIQCCHAYIVEHLRQRMTAPALPELLQRFSLHG